MVMALLGHNGAVSPSVVAPSGPVGQAVPATYRYDLAAVPRANSRSADDHAASGDSVALRKEIGVALRIIAGIGVTVAALALAGRRAWWLYRAGRACSWQKTPKGGPMLLAGDSRAGGEPKPPQAAPVKSRGGERCGKGPLSAGQVGDEKTNVCEPLLTHR